MISLTMATVMLAARAAAQPAAGPEAQKSAAPKAIPADANSLDALLAAALKSNPDILVAEAKVREAEAGLNKARVTVMQQVVAAHGALDNAKATLATVEKILDRIRRISASGQISSIEVEKAEIDVQKAKAAVATAEADLALLLGKTPMTGWKAATALPTHGWTPVHATFTPDGNRLWTAEVDGGVRIWDTVTGQQVRTYVGESKPGSMPEKVRAALEKTIKIDTWKESLPLADVIDYLKQKAGADIPVRVVVRPQSAATVDLMAGSLPLSAWLLAVEDSVADLRIVVREYGLLVTTRDRMPDDAVRLRDFLRAPPVKPTEAKKP
jgi:hypothetical protein